MNSGYLKSEKALDFSNLNLLLYFFLVTYMKKCVEIWRFFTFKQHYGYLKYEKALDYFFLATNSQQKKGCL
jgi:hypothetical protein